MKAFSAAKATDLRNAWFGQLSSIDLAAKFGLASDQMVRKFWRQEKAAGRLPRHLARPHFEVRTTLPPAPVALGIDPVDVDFDDPSQDGVDRAPRVPCADPLLSALQAVHGRDRLRGINDEMPAQLLMIEAGDEYGRYTPSRQRVLDFQRGRDAYAAAKMPSKPAPSNCIYARVGRTWWLRKGAEMIAGPFLIFEAAQDWVRAQGAVHKGKSA